MILYGAWKVSLPDHEEYLWEPDEVTLGEQMMLENEAKSSYDEWCERIAEDHAEAWQILIWFLRLKAGKQEDRGSVNVKLRKATITRVAVMDDPEASAGSEPATGSSSESTTESGTATSIA